MPLGNTRLLKKSPRLLATTNRYGLARLAKHNAVCIDAIIGPDEASQRGTNLVGRAARALGDYLLGEL